MTQGVLLKMPEGSIRSQHAVRIRDPIYRGAERPDDRNVGRLPAAVPPRATWSSRILEFQVFVPRSVSDSERRDVETDNVIINWPPNSTASTTSPCWLLMVLYKMEFRITFHSRISTKTPELLATCCGYNPTPRFKSCFRHHTPKAAE